MRKLILSLWTWAIKPFLALLVARFLYAIAQGIFRVDPAQWLASKVLTAPSAAWVEIGRWAIVSIPALAVLIGYEIWRHRHQPTWRASNGAALARTTTEEVQRTSNRSSEPDVVLGDAFWRAFLGIWDPPTHDPNLMSTSEPWPGYWEQFCSFVETEVRQAAFDGNLPIWGRKVGHWVTNSAKQAVRQSIPKEFWEHNWIEILDFLHHDPDKLTTTTDALHKSDERWRDLWTNRNTIEQLWPRGQAPSVAPAARVPILDLVKAAEGDGWVISGNRNVLHLFCQALRQAALDGAIQIQGRPRNRMQDFKWALRNNPLEPINSAYFKDHWISVHMGWVSNNENGLTRAADALDKEADYFIDLHIMRPQAWKWLTSGDARAARDKALVFEADERKRISAHPISAGQGGYEGEEIEGK